MNKFIQESERLMSRPRKWLVTGAAGFIGSNLVEWLLVHDQYVVGVDNFSTGFRHNLEAARLQVDETQWNRLQFIEGDICDFDVCRSAVEGVDYVLHQAALGSVPRSMDDPIKSNASNVDGFLNMLVSSRDAAVTSFTYAASSSTYGDHPGLPKQESVIGRPLSPYAVTKYVNELYADVFAKCYGFSSVGLRYFNVFGPRQDPHGAYAAVIPRWIAGMLAGETVGINGDGETSRDFCYIANAVQANILAAVVPAAASSSRIYNVAVGDRTTLNDLYRMLEDGLDGCLPGSVSRPEYLEFRDGDVRHSQASIVKITNDLGYEPEYPVGRGILETCKWFVSKQSATGNT